MKKNSESEKIEVILGFSGNAELVAYLDRLSEEEKPLLENMTCQFGGTSANVGSALAKMNVKAKLFTLIGYDDDFFTYCLKFALKNSHPNIKHVNFRILEDGNMGYIPIDGIKPNTTQVYGHKGKMQTEKIAKCIAIIQKEKGSVWRVATGVRPSEVGLVKALFGEKHRGFRYLNPRKELILEKETFFDLLMQTDILVVNQKEFDICISYDNLNSMADLQDKFGISLIVVTKGEDGGKYSLSTKVATIREKYKAYSAYTEGGVKTFTTGAGDWFAGALISSFVKTGKSILEITESEVHQAINFAAKVAGKKVTMMGAGNGPSESDL